MSDCQCTECQQRAERWAADDAEQLRAELAVANAKIARVEELIEELVTRMGVPDGVRITDDDMPQIVWEETEVYVAGELIAALKGA